MEKHNLLSKSQFGFWNGTLITDAIGNLVDMIVDGNGSRKNTLSIFLDLSKAYGCVDHNILTH